MSLVDQALVFATRAHAEQGQVRKYTGEPYIVHPIEVMMLVRSAGGDEAMQCAALLHDVLEDTNTSSDELVRDFGDDITDMVWWLTDADEGNRAARFQAAMERLAQAPADVQTIKLADIISNSRSIMQHDPKFAVVYLAEKRRMLSVLTAGDARLYWLAESYLPPAEDAA